MDAYKTHGAFSWNELMTTDPAGALAFYRALFGWASQDMDMGTGPYHVVKVGDTPVGGVMGMPPDAAPGTPPCWGSYVTVTDCDATVAQCTALGGRVLMPPTDVPTVGRMAVLQDPQGAVFNVMAYSA
jgi:predicted enzyme related to lactoylglutathione lyase